MKSVRGVSHPARENVRPAQKLSLTFFKKLVDEATVSLHQSKGPEVTKCSCAHSRYASDRFEEEDALGV